MDCFSLFSGCGGSDVGMIAAGYTSIGGIEYHHPAADIYDLNHEVKVTRADILTINSIPTVDLLWMSPVCKSFSVANINKGEKEHDIKMATHIAKLAVDSRSQHIAIENVRAYQHSESLKIITAALKNAGYTIDMAIYNAANYGAPTTRERLIVRATLGSLNPVIRTHQKPTNQLGLFQLPNWISWWDVVKDRVSELPKSHLTENQIKSIENWWAKKWDLEHPLLVCSSNSGGDDGRGATHRHPVRSKSKPCFTLLTGGGVPKLLVDGSGNNYGSSFTIRHEITPSNTITASIAKHPMRILIERVGYYNGEPKTYDNSIPSPTIRSAQHIDDKSTYRVALNIIDNYECLAADVTCLADWQSFPRGYQWGDNKGEAGRAIGNAVPPKLAEAIARSFTSL